MWEAAARCGPER